MTYKKHLCGHCGDLCCCNSIDNNTSAMAATDPFGIEELYETKDEKTLHGFH
jgi:hypothetical protein